MKLRRVPGPKTPFFLPMLLILNSRGPSGLRYLYLWNDYVITPLLALVNIEC